MHQPLSRLRVRARVLPGWMLSSPGRYVVQGGIRPGGRLSMGDVGGRVGTLVLPLTNLAGIRFFLLCALALFVSMPAMAQDQTINRFTLYTGFDYMINSSENLTQRGFDTDFGVTVKPWLGLGADFSAAGDASDIRYRQADDSSSARATERVVRVWGQLGWYLRRPTSTGPSHHRNVPSRNCILRRRQIGLRGARGGVCRDCQRRWRG
jgi:hypothetical protein